MTTTAPTSWATPCDNSNHNNSSPGRGKSHPCAGYLDICSPKWTFYASLNELSCQNRREERTITLVQNPLPVCCSVSIDEGEVQVAFRLVITIKQRVCFSFHALQKRFLCWVKPPEASLVLGTLTDLLRGKSELIAENALLRQQLTILHRQIKRPVVQKEGPASPGAPGQNGSDLETGALPCPARDASSLAS